MALAAKNLMRSETGRAFMAVRDMDVAASVIGIPMMKTKLLAFAISSFYCGVAGALDAFCFLGTVEPERYSLDLSFRILFMLIIGGVGSILGSFLGAAFITLFPIFLNLVSGWISHTTGFEISHAVISNLEAIIFGGLIIFFLIVEPHGFARLWQIAKEKLGCGRSRIDGAILSRSAPEEEASMKPICPAVWLRFWLVPAAGVRPGQRAVRPGQFLLGRPVRPRRLGHRRRA